MAVGPTRHDQLVLTVAATAVVGVLCLGLWAWPQYVERQEWERVQTALRETKEIEAALQRLMADAGVTELRAGGGSFASTVVQAEGDTNFCAGLLREGRNYAPFGGPPLFPDRLADHYLDVGLDPWGRPYRMLLSTSEWLRAGIVACVPSEMGGPKGVYPAPDGIPVYVMSLGPNGHPDPGPGPDIGVADDIGAWVVLP